MNTPNRLAVTVASTDGRTTRIGPIPTRQLSEDMHHSLSAYSTRPEREGTTCEITDYDPTVEHLPLLPTTAPEIAELISDPRQGFEAPFPNLWERLVAQIGLAEGDVLWRQAFALYVDDEQARERPADRLNAADELFTNNLRQRLTELVASRAGDVSAKEIDDAVVSIQGLAADWARNYR
ncbi:hypothetical protein [Streptomyces sp. NBC_01304]|uniref:hypothetical protein n=1 Tax=Streptomyces sp. NBC_01304 TaxID=2903818 RepID=UPI002E12B740|nr:hypothetical protein OG430_47730 [Streptomyces sp. NBC_01304]